MPTTSQCCDNLKLPSTLHGEVVYYHSSIDGRCQNLNTKILLKNEFDDGEWKGEFLADSQGEPPIFSMSVVCSGVETLLVDVTYNLDGCDDGFSGDILMNCGFPSWWRIFPLSVSPSCCDVPPKPWEEVYHDVGIRYTSPIAVGVPPTSPQPCSELPPQDQACCRAARGGGGGGAGGNSGGPPTCSGGSCFAGGSYGPNSASGPSDYTEAPVQYATGSLLVTATDIESGAFGKSWGHTRSFANRLSVCETLGNGFNWQVAQWPYLVIDHKENVVVQGKSGEALWFDKTENGYTAKFNVKQTFELDETDNVYKLHDLDGTLTEFDKTTGRFVRRTSPGGQEIEVTGVHSNGYNITEVERENTSGSVTETERLSYDYDDASGDQLLETVTLQRKTGTAAWTNISRASYTYYDNLDLDGLEGDLATVNTQKWDGSAWQDTGTTLYRYYAEEASDPSSSSSSSSGGSPATGTRPIARLLKYVVNPAAYARLVADPQVNDPLTTSDEKVAEYADFYFEYDSERRVTKETINGGEQTFTLSYSESTNADGYNSWKTKTVETLPDGSQRIVYSNFAAQPMLKIRKMGDDESYEFFKYNGDAQLILRAEPSAVTGYDEQYADLLHESAGEYEYLRDNDGLIRLTEYHAATGWVATEKIQKGQLGTAIKLHERQYATGGSATPAVYFRSKDIVYPSDTDQTKKIETSYTYTFHSGTSHVLQRTTTLPAVSAAQNGSGTSATRVERFDTFGNLVWTKNERGYIIHHEYDDRALRISTIQDVDDTFLTVPSGWETPNDGGKHLETDYETDDLGRVTQILGPEHDIDQQTVRTATWMVYDDVNHEVRTAHGYAVSDGDGSSSSSSSETYTYTLVNPVTIRKSDAGGKVLEEIQVVRASTSGKLSASDTFGQPSYTRWTTHHYNVYGQVTATRVYHTIPTSGNGASGTNYDEQRFGYDSRARLNVSATPGGTITRSVFDHHGNRTAEWIGTDDTDATDSDPTGNSATGNNMVVVAEFEYDSGCGCGGADGRMTEETRHVDSTTTRVTEHDYDWRGRRVTTDGELDYFEKRYYDNLDRVVKTERYDTTEQGNLIARSESFYDDLGRVYQTKRYAVNVDTGTVGNALVSNTWYDASGNTIKQQSAGSQAFTKTVYDSLARPVKRYVGHDTDETAYGDASSVSDDTIVEQVETAYDDARNVLQTTTRQRFHNATGTGELTTPSGSQPKARVTYQAMYHDEVGRQIAVAEYGTYGGATFDRAAVVPNRTDTILVTSTEYNDAGQAYKTIDPAGKEHRTMFDAAGRKVKAIQNYVDGNPATGSADEDVTVEMAYTPDGNIETLTAKNSSTGDQTTTYVYGTTLSDSGVATSTLKRAEIYPDSDDTVALGDGTDGIYDRIEFNYDRQQAVVEVKDQQGTIHAFAFDALGRQSQDRVTTLGSGVDGAVRRIATEFDVLGRKAKITSYDNPTAGSGSVVNDLAFVYDDFGQLVTEYQEHGGAVNTSTSLKVQYAYEDGTDNNVRLTQMTYPDGRELNYDYGSSGSTNDALSRVVSLIDDDGSTHLVDYSYLGRNKFVKTDYPEPDLRYDLAMGAGDDPYDGFDRFGRIVDSRWYDYGSATDVDRIQYGYDRAGNRTHREQMCDPNSHHDEVYGYDGVNRLTDFDRGTINEGKDAMSTLKFAQAWALDPTGNWSGFKEDSDGDSSWDLDQNRTSNKVNEITDITETSGPAWATPAYNRAGNMTTIPKPAAPTASFTATYDAWNRLTKLEEGENTLAEYLYDGAKRRVVKKTYSDGSLDETRHFYYTDPQKWQVIEERLESGEAISSDSDRQFIWGLRYIDDFLLRDRDTDSNGTLEERLYALQDANWNVTALADAGGTVQERYAYTAYGTPRMLTPTFGTRASSNCGAVVLYAGYRYDAECGIFHVRHRSLQSALGSWLQRDPLRYSDGPHLYEYVGDAPLFRTDAMGQSWLCDVAESVLNMDGFNCLCELMAAMDIANEVLFALGVFFGLPFVGAAAAVFVEVMDCLCNAAIAIDRVCTCGDWKYTIGGLVPDCIVGLIGGPFAPVFDTVITGFEWCAIDKTITDAMENIEACPLVPDGFFVPNTQAEVVCLDCTSLRGCYLAFARQQPRLSKYALSIHYGAMRSTSPAATPKRRYRLMAVAMVLSLPLQVLGLRLVASIMFAEEVTPSIKRSLDGTTTFVLQSSLSAWFTLLLLILLAANAVAFSIVLAKGDLDQSALASRSVSPPQLVLGAPVLLIFLIVFVAFFTVLATPFREFRQVTVQKNSLQLTALSFVRTIDRGNVASVDVAMERVSQNDDRLTFAVLIHLKTGECVRSVKTGRLKPRSTKMQKWQDFFASLRREIGKARP